MANSGPTTSSEATRQALVEAALALFGEKGFDATSTREIASAANANIGSIAYHFGSKAGLYRACAEFIVGTLGGALGSRLREAAETDASGLTRQEARARLLSIMDAFAAFLITRPETLTIVRFMLHEMTQPTEALDLIYDELVGPAHRRLCALWAAASGMDADDPDTLLTGFALIGQILYFRIGREVVMRRMTWNKVGPPEMQMITAVLKENLAAILDHHIEKRGKSAS